MWALYHSDVPSVASSASFTFSWSLFGGTDLFDLTDPQHPLALSQAVYTFSNVFQGTAPWTAGYAAEVVLASSGSGSEVTDDLFVTDNTQLRPMGTSALTVAMTTADFFDVRFTNLDTAARSATCSLYVLLLGTY